MVPYTKPAKSRTKSKTVQVQNPVFAMPDKVQLLSGRCLVSRTTRYSSYRLHKVWSVTVQGGKTSRGPCTPCGLEAGFMDKVPGIKFHLVQFCRVGGKSWHAVAFCCQRGNETRLIGRKPSRVGKKWCLLCEYGCQRGQIQTQVFALEPFLSPDRMTARQKNCPLKNLGDNWGT